MKPIDLGKKWDGPMALPEAPGKDEESKVHYPCLYVDTKEGSDLADLPDEGTMTVRYKIVSRTLSEREGKKSASLSIDVQKILDVEGEKSKSDDKSAGEELDKLAESEKNRDEDDSY